MSVGALTQGCQNVPRPLGSQNVYRTMIELVLYARSQPSARNVNEQVQFSQSPTKTTFASVPPGRNIPERCCQ